MNEDRIEEIIEHLKHGRKHIQPWIETGQVIEVLHSRICELEARVLELEQLFGRDK